MTSVLDWFQDVLSRTSPWVGVLALALCLVTGIFAGLRTSRWVVARRAARSRRLGSVGEARAFALVDRAGFRVIQREAVAEGVLWVDGEPHAYVVRADALIERGGRTFVAELKGGPQASKVTNRATRRQLLEYAFVFDVDGIVLVDAYAGRIRAVRFRPESAQ